MKTQNRASIFWSLLNYNDWKLYIAATEKGLCYVGAQNKTIDDLSTWAEKRFPDCSLVEDQIRMYPYEVELKEYFAGERKEFTNPIDYHGTEFQVSVWNALCEIPYGETKSYSEIANHIKKPAAVRAVGAAIGANPLLITVPCHRVVGKNGSLTGYRGGLVMKSKLLKLEQV